jgi:hypothetical protein
MFFGRAGQQPQVTGVVLPLHQSRRQRWVDPGALGVPRIDRGDSPPARRTCPVEEGSPEPRDCCAAEVGWSDGPAGPQAMPSLRLQDLLLDEHRFRSLGKLVVGDLDRIAYVDNVGN